MTRQTLKLLDLPKDLEEEILSRVPVTCLGQLQYTCKRWRSLFIDTEFIKRFGSVLMLIDNKVLNVNLHGIHNDIVDPTIEVKGGLSLNDLHHVSDQVGILEVFTCDGLLLCTATHNRLVVWNPYNGQTRWIQPRYFDDKKTRYGVAFSLGYENNKSCHSYKILRCWPDESVRYPCRASSVVRFEIYEFSSGSWRVLDDEFALDCLILTNGVSLKGNTYSLAQDINDGSRFLLSFDFTTEKHSRLCLPFASNMRYTNAITLSVVREEKLSVLHQRRGAQEMEIWVTTNDEIDDTKVLSWKKFLAVDIITHRDCPFSRNISFFIDEEKKVAVCCDERYEGKNNIRNIVCIIGEDKYREISFGDVKYRENSFLEIRHRSLWPFIFNYVPSFAQIKQG